MLEAEIEFISCNLQTLYRVFLESVYKPKSIFSPGEEEAFCILKYGDQTKIYRNYSLHKIHPEHPKSQVLFLVFVFNHTEPKETLKPFLYFWFLNTVSF